MRRIVIISDTQIPFHSEIAVSNLIEFIRAWRPDHVVHIGDLMDFPTPSRWSKDTRAEFAGSVMKDCEAGKRFLGDLRSVYYGPMDVIIGNHDERPATYLEANAPALAEYPFDLATLLDFDSHGVNQVSGFMDIAPGWVATHGHLGFSLSQIGGVTAQRAAQKIGKSVVMGHTHRLGLVGHSQGYGGYLETKWGFEVGHLCDLKKMDYVMKKSGGANWQAGFGLLYVDGDKVFPKPVAIAKDGSFEVDGYLFGGNERRAIAA